MMKDDAVLTLGATSLIGGALCALPGRPALICVSRAPPPSLPPNTHWVRADLTDPQWGRGWPDLHVTKALALAPIWTVAPVIDDLADRGVRRLVAFSSTSRFTKAASPDPGERKVADRLARSEARLIDACDRRGVAWTLLRPTLIYLEGKDENITRLARLIRRFGALPLAGDGSGLRQPVHAEDLAIVAFAALDAPAAIGRAYDLPGGETLTYRAMVERVFEGLERRPRILALPPQVWRLGFALARPFLPGASVQMGARMEADLIFDSAPARADLNWRPRAFHPRFPAEAA
jgi:nucleoside-diphosphate-sugar epimerase